MAIDPKVIAVAQAIKQSLEQNAGPGSAINAHPNQFFLNVSGAVDLYRAAEAAVARVVQFEESARVRFENDVKAFATKIAEEFTAGAVSIEDALARLKTKAGGELTAAEGVVEAAIAYDKSKFVSRAS